MLNHHHRELRAVVGKSALGADTARNRRAPREPGGGEVSELDQRTDVHDHANPEPVERRRRLVRAADLELVFAHLWRTEIDQRAVDGAAEFVAALGFIDRGQRAAQAARAVWINRWRRRAKIKSNIEGSRGAGGYRHLSCFLPELNGILFGGMARQGSARLVQAGPGAAGHGGAGGSSSAWPRCIPRRFNADR